MNISAGTVTAPPPVVFEMMLGVAKQHIIWGGNYFADLLPPSMRWLVWDKGQRINQSDGELAWTSMQQALRILTMNRVELLKDGTNHPTQKPVALMLWCLSQIDLDALSICDPFMGSGTTGVACVQRGKHFTGIEREVKYFDMTCWRIDAAVREKKIHGETDDMFKFEKPKQESFL